MSRVLRRPAIRLAVLLPLLGCFWRADARLDEATQAPAVREFSEHVRQYAELHRRIKAMQPALRPTESAEEIAARRHALADALRQARQNASAGDIFTPSVAAHFRRIIQADVRQTGTAVVGAAQPEKPDVALRVNEKYPTNQPLSSVPPLLLKQLPPLPEELEYRFVGQHLLLLDAEANLIVDYLPDAANR